MHKQFHRLRIPLYSIGLVLALAVSAAAPPAQLRPRFISPEHVDGVALLPPPPESGSAEQEADFATVRSVCKARTPEQVAAALKTASLSMFLFESAMGEWFKPGALPKTEALFNDIKTQMSGIIDECKDHWKRPRPHHLEPELAVGRVDQSFSYPSGHSTRGTVYSLFFAELAPEKKDDILRIGRQIGWDRVIIAKHYPTDVFAGRVVGKEVFRQLMSNARFREALAEARAEIQSAQMAVSK